MANFRDVEMLQNALQNLGEGALKRRTIDQQHETEMQRLQLESQLRDIQEARANANEANNQRMESTQRDFAEKSLSRQDDAAARASQPKIQATLTHPGSNSSMTFLGTPEQLDAMIQKDPQIKVSDKKSFSAKFDVGGSSFMFDDSDAAEKFASDMKAKHGIDVYAPVAPVVGQLPTGQPTITDPKGRVKLGEMPAKPPTGYTTTNIKQIADPSGGTNGPISLTNTTTRLPVGYPPAPAAAQKSPPIGHIQFLQSNPKFADQFDLKYGQGAAAKYLKPIPGGGGLPIDAGDEAQ